MSCGRTCRQGTALVGTFGPDHCVSAAESTGLERTYRHLVQAPLKAIILFPEYIRDLGWYANCALIHFAK